MGEVDLFTGPVLVDEEFNLAKSFGYSQYYGVILASGEISANAKQVWNILKFHAKNRVNTAPDQERIAEWVPCSVRTVRTALQELEAIGLIGIDRKYYKSERKTKNSYTMRRVTLEIIQALAPPYVSDDWMNGVLSKQEEPPGDPGGEDPETEQEPEKKKNKQDDRTEEKIQQVWDAYMESLGDQWGRTPKFTPERRRIIKKALEGDPRVKAADRIRYSLDELKTLFDYIRQSKWHCGENERGKKYIDLSNIMGSTDKIERNLENAYRQKQSGNGYRKEKSTPTPGADDTQKYLADLFA